MGLPNFKKGSRQDYDALSVKDEDTIYVVSEDGEFNTPSSSDTPNAVYLGCREIGEELKPANNNRLGGVKAIAKTASHTEEVAVDVNGKLFVKPGGSSIQQPIPIMTSTTVGGGKAIPKTATYTEKIAVATDGTLYSKKPPVMTNTVYGVAKAAIADGTENKLVAINRDGELCYKESTGGGIGIEGNVKVYHTSLIPININLNNTSWTEVLRIEGLRNGTYLVNFAGQIYNSTTKTVQCFLTLGYSLGGASHTDGGGNVYNILPGDNTINFSRVKEISATNQANNHICIFLRHAQTVTHGLRVVKEVAYLTNDYVVGCTKLTCLLITDPIAYPASGSGEGPGEKT